jgi:uncharacterized protein (DUF486 family)
MITKATPELSSLLNKYNQIFPEYTFPYLPFVIAALFQTFAWTSGSIFLKNYTLIPRVLILLLFAAGEYTFMSPAINAGVEVKNMDERHLVVTYQVITLIVFMMVSIFIYKQKFKLKYGFAFLFSGLAIYCANYD